MGNAGLLAIPWVLGLWLVVCAANVLGAPVKCVQAGTGRVTYRDAPCDDPRDERMLIIVDNVVATEPRASRASPATSPSHSAGPMALGPARSTPRLSGSGTSACLAARRDYEIAVSEIKKDLQSMNRRYREALRSCGEHVDQAAEHESLARRKPSPGPHSRGATRESAP